MTLVSKLFLLFENPIFWEYISDFFGLCVDRRLWMTWFRPILVMRVLCSLLMVLRLVFLTVATILLTAAADSSSPLGCSTIVTPRYLRWKTMPSNRVSLVSVQFSGSSARLEKCTSDKSAQQQPSCFTVMIVLWCLNKVSIMCFHAKKSPVVHPGCLPQSVFWWKEPFYGCVT